MSDALHLAGRTAEALEVARAGHAELASLPTRQGWLSLLIAQQSFDSGDWEAADAALAEVARRRLTAATGSSKCCCAGRAGARARRVRGGAGQLARAAEVAVDSREPQYLGVLGALQTELAAR